jgi:SAM-dependent methyltransferase
MTPERRALDEDLARRLRCPHGDGEPLEARGETLRCTRGHAFPVVRGIPVLLRADAPSTHPLWWTTPAQLAAARVTAPVAALAPGEIEPFVRRASVATCGRLYRGMRDPLPRYPIASLDALPPGDGRSFLDVGGNWGRWGLGAAARGYRAIVVDPSLRAALAGQRIADALGAAVSYVVADGRHLPFAEGAFAVSFSYSVLQHLPKDDVRAVVAEMARVTERDGTVRVQMANLLGLRRMTQTLAERGRDFVRRLRDPAFSPWAFRVRSWTPREIARCFEELVGPTTLSIDGFFSLNAQLGDVDLLRRRYAAVVHASRALTRLAGLLPRMLYVADSLYAQARNTRGAAGPKTGTR